MYISERQSSDGQTVPYERFRTKLFSRYFGERGLEQNLAPENLSQVSIDVMNKPYIKRCGINYTKVTAPSYLGPVRIDSYPRQSGKFTFILHSIPCALNPFRCIRGQAVIGIDYKHQLTLRGPDRLIDDTVLASVFLTKVTYRKICLTLKLRHELRCPVGRVIVSYDPLKVADCLRLDGIKECREQGCPVESGCNY